MSVTLADVQRIAQLARLRFSPAEEERLVDELTRILAYVEELSDLDLSDVPPMVHAGATAANWREDAVEQRISHDEALQNAPSADGTYFRVPKVIE